ncbi:hypothetical protein ACE1SV_00890 [Streptomyces sennicomposti]
MPTAAVIERTDTVISSCGVVCPVSGTDAHEEERQALCPPDGDTESFLSNSWLPRSVRKSDQHPTRPVTGDADDNAVGGA